MRGNGAPGGGAALLERASAYALSALRNVAPHLLGRPTPCGDWDLRALLWHTNDSLTALCEGMEDGRVALPPPHPDRKGGAAGSCDATVRLPAGSRPGTSRASGPVPLPDGRDDPVAAVRGTAARLLAVRTAAGGHGQAAVAIGGRELAAQALERAGALEVAVHGWDIARSTGLPRPVPTALAAELLEAARESIPAAEMRLPLFGPPVPVAADAGPSDRLVAFLGRTP